jgi:hypothetical protein
MTTGELLWVQRINCAPAHLKTRVTARIESLMQVCDTILSEVVIAAPEYVGATRGLVAGGRNARAFVAVGPLAYRA